MSAELIADAKARGEVLSHVDPLETARLMVGAWTGVELVTEVDRASRSRADPREIAALFRLVLPTIAVPGALVELDTSSGRARGLFERVIAEAEAEAEADAGAAADAEVSADTR